MDNVELSPSVRDSRRPLKRTTLNTPPLDQFQLQHQGYVNIWDSSSPHIGDGSVIAFSLGIFTLYTGHGSLQALVLQVCMHRQKRFWGECVPAYIYIFKCLISILFNYITNWMLLNIMQHPLHPYIVVCTGVWCVYRYVPVWMAWLPCPYCC